MNRYHRQSILPEIGDAGQARLAQGTVLIAGCGALGCTIADLLARAGVGRLRIVDRDVVEETNLQRQSLYVESDIMRPKATAAGDRLRAVNSTIEIETHVRDLNRTTIASLAAGCSAIVDGLDNFETRYLINDFTQANDMPWVYGGAIGTEGMSMGIVPSGCHAQHATACLRCLFPEPPPVGTTPTCDTAGVLGPLIAMVAAHEAMQILKMLLDRFDELDRSLLSIDVWGNQTRRLSPPTPREDCPCCSLGRYDWLQGDRGGRVTTMCGRGSVQVLPEESQSPPALDAIEKRLADHGDFILRDGVLRGSLREERDDRGDPVDLMIFADLRAVVGHVDTPERAKAIYDRYVGA